MGKAWLSSAFQQRGEDDAYLACLDDGAQNTFCGGGNVMEGEAATRQFPSWLRISEIWVVAATPVNLFVDYWLFVFHICIRF